MSALWTFIYWVAANIASVKKQCCTTFGAFAFIPPLKVIVTDSKTPNENDDGGNATN